MTSYIDLAYAAGIIDGEGCIGIYAVGPSGSLDARVQVAMTDLEVPEWLEALFGGRLYYRERHGKHKTVATWVISGRAAADFCSTVGPFLRVKRRQADLIRELFADDRYALVQRGRRGARRERLSGEQLALRAEYARRSRSLNAREVANAGP